MHVKAEEYSSQKSIPYHHSNYMRMYKEFCAQKNKYFLLVSPSYPYVPRSRTGRSSGTRRRSTGSTARGRAPTAFAASHRGHVHAKGDVTNHAVAVVDAIQGLDLHLVVEALAVDFLEDAVHVVGRAVDLRVRRVGGERHDLLAERLAEADLARGPRVARDDGAVGADDPLGVCLDVDVDRTLDVEAREDGLHLHDTVVVRRPHAAEEGSGVGVEVELAVADGDVELVEELLEGSVGAEAREGRVATGGVAWYELAILKLRLHTRQRTVPHVNQDVGRGLARVHIQNTNVQVERNTGLVLGHVLPERLTSGPNIGSSSRLGHEDARVVLDGGIVRRFGCDVYTRITGNDAGTQRALLERTPHAFLGESS